MIECVVIRAFTDKYTKVKYEVGTKLSISEERFSEMNEKRQRVIKLIEPEVTNEITTPAEPDTTGENAEEVTPDENVTPAEPETTGDNAEEVGTKKGKGKK